MENNIDWSWANPYLDKICGDFYNPKKLLSYHRPLNIVQSSRSSGKTTIFAILMLLNYIKKGKRFWYMRRTDDETVLGARSFFQDSLEILKMYYPDIDYTDIFYEGGKFFLSKVEYGEEVKEEIGRAMPLSMVYKRKSVIQPECNAIVFDEFVAVSSKEYLGKEENVTEEPERLFNFYTTTDRGIGKAFKNETTVFCLGNSTTLYCPLFIYLDAVKYISKESKFIAPKRKDWVIERFDRVAATKDIEQSFGYKLSSMSERNKMYNNDTGEWGGAFVLPEKPQKSECMVNIVFAGKTLGIWWSDYKSIWWVGSKDLSAPIYSLDIEGHEMTDAELCYAINDFKYAENLKKAYVKSRLFFASYDIMRTILGYLKLK